MSLLDKLRDRLTKTRQQVFGRLHEMLGGTTQWTKETLERVEEILVTADLGVKLSQEIVQHLDRRIKKDKIKETAMIHHLLEEEIERRILSVRTCDLGEELQRHTPFVVFVVGVNGVGKTTTIGKLAHRMASMDKKILLVAADTFRAAASDQLEIWARRAGVDLVRQGEGADPSSVVFDALESAKSKRHDVVLVDTAGRLHTKSHLMEELKKMKRVIQKQIPDAPHATWLVLDAGTGQNAIQQAREFTQSVGLTGLILTKLDGTAKGGVVLAIQSELNLPVVFIGVGEAPEDLEPFRAHDFISAIVE